jgi:phosphatidylglycerol---prolipoprotein diacylglyceryl transferase
MLIHWNFDPVLLQLGPLSVRWYGLLFVGGFLAGQVLLGRIFRREGLDSRSAQDLLLYALVGAVIGARLVHCLAYEPSYYLSHPVEIFRVWEGGLASHGGVVGVFAGLIVAARQQNPPLKLLWLLDRVAIPSAFAATAIRFANFLNSEIVGTPTSGSWGVVFATLDQIPRHPVQLYEASAYLGIGLLLWTLYRSGAGRRPGLLLGTLFALAFSARVVLEFFKTPQASYDGSFALSAGRQSSGSSEVGWPVALARSPPSMAATTLVLKASAREQKNLSNPTSSPMQKLSHGTVIIMALL